MTSPLPELPPQRRNKEADITPRIFKWLEDNWSNSALVEIKIKGNKPLKHQVAALEKTASGPFSHKIKDMGARNPADGFVLHGADALLITYLGDNEIEVYNYRDDLSTRYPLA